MTKKHLITIYSIQQMFHWLIIGIAIPVLILIFQSKNLNLQEIGIIMAVYVGTTALLEIPLGGIADKYGRKMIYLLSIIVHSLGYLSLYFSNDFFTLFITAIILGAARSIYSGTLDAWFYDTYKNITGNISYHQGLAYINVMITIGLALGSLIGGYLPDYVVKKNLNISSIYNLNIIIIIIANIPLFIFTSIMIKENKSTYIALQKDKRSIIKETLKTLKSSFKHSTIKRLMQTMLIYGGCLISIENFWQPYLANLISKSGFSTMIFGIITALYFLMSAASSLSSLLAVKLFKGSHKRLLFISRSLSGLLFIALAFSTNIYFFSLFYLAFFFMFTLGNNSETILLNENTKEKERSTMLSINSFIMTAGAIIFSLVLGIISEHFGISINWIICGILLISTSFFFLLIPNKKIKALS